MARIWWDASLRNFGAAATCTYMLGDTHNPNGRLTSACEAANSRSRHTIRALVGVKADHCNEKKEAPMTNRGLNPK